MRLALLCCLVFPGLALLGLLFLGQVPTDWGSGRSFAAEQPIPFSHKHHVKALGLDCRYCHDTVETSASAGYPSTHVCMTCHSQIWTEAEMLAPLRQSFAEGKPVRWKRLNDLPDFVYFHHGVHVQAGVQCASCHGDVTTMPLMRQGKSLTMSFCIDCHRDRRLVPAGEVFNPHPYSPPEDIVAYLDEQNVQSPEELEACNACHR